MHLNHVNLCSSDVPVLAETLSTHFAYRIVDAGEFPAADGSRRHYAALVGADGSELVLTQIDPPADGRSAYPAGFHVGLIQDSRDAVYAKHDELVAAGLEPGQISDGFEVWGATWTAFYCLLGDGLQIEVNFRTPSDLLDVRTSAASPARAGRRRTG